MDLIQLWVTQNWEHRMPEALIDTPAKLLFDYFSIGRHSLSLCDFASPDKNLCTWEINACKNLGVLTPSAHMILQRVDKEGCNDASKVVSGSMPRCHLFLKKPVITEVLTSGRKAIWSVCRSLEKQILFLADLTDLKNQSPKSGDLRTTTGYFTSMASRGFWITSLVKFRS